MYLLKQKLQSIWNERRQLLEPVKKGKAKRGERRDRNQEDTK